MAERIVKWTRTADIQYIGVLEYWAKRNKSTVYSKKLIKLITERTKQIGKSPFIYKSVDFEGTRVASLGNFSIFYKVTDDEIIITSFWDNRQDPKKLLQILNEKNK
ncbi:ParE-like toxin of type II ParDE toxin-antitoxin system [Kordia periserrulae]|uniref:ParE-like toxin of type II ParDE toxin-antitoxin system n=1 Tax=Kordia periserrulae TaxID=701523 RepID=A0A2T6C3I8_9FLAO|nr:type II toxin-antitoxin system RelE/ParE family toxin [Kordia periserrulae]PTX62891.1 ParE-like toxin of type II ParDE toxin-antitoxin system [Kordia periserrulae]